MRRLKSRTKLKELYTMKDTYQSTIEAMERKAQNNDLLIDFQAIKPKGVPLKGTSGSTKDLKGSDEILELLKVLPNRTTRL